MGTRLIDGMPQAAFTASYLQEQQELWSLAWINYETVEQKLKNLPSREKTFSAEICRECYDSIFPETYITGKSKYIKFHRCLKDNFDIFEAIATGKCRCHPDQDNFQAQATRTVTFLPACTAAVSGNLPMLKYLTKTTFGQKWTKSKTIAGTLPKGCLKSSQTKGSKKVNFVEGHAEILEETALGEILLHALYGGNEECIHFLINNLEKGSLTPRDILSALDMTLRVQRDDIFLKIVDIYGHQVITWSDSIATPLILAACFGHIHLVETLLSMGANPLGRNSDGDTAVKFALCSDLNDGETIALMILSHIQTSDIENDFMIMALKRSKFRVIKFLLDRGITQIEVWHRPAKLKIPLIHCILQFMFGSKLYHLIEFLIINNQDCRTACGVKNETPLHLMFQNDIKGPVCDLLLTQSTSVNILDSEGNTPLYLALRKHCYVEAVKLLAAGASLKCGDCVRIEGSIFKMALLSKNYAVLQMLLHAGYRCSQADVEQLKKEEVHLPVDLVVSIAKLRGETLPLTTLCASSLREGLQDHCSRYMKAMGTPKMVVDFVNLKHLAERFLGVHDERFIIYR